ncbi:MAG: ribonuclease H family protein [Muribaculaceae bacterium]|nr:ribonuclease H family protein [Muribaculaceae bacterium]
MKYYAVKNGRRTGVFATWPECEAQVKGFPGAVYKSFKSQAEAEAFAAGAPAGTSVPAPGQTAQILEAPYAFVDGSYNPKTEVSGWGGFLVLADGSEIELTGSTDNPQFTEMRNVAGEILGSMDAVQEAMGHNINKLHIYYDYMGIEAWATGAWKANKPGTMAYARFMQAARDELQMELVFHKVAAHTGIPGNERADQLAKRAVGL